MFNFSRKRIVNVLIDSSCNLFFFLGVAISLPVSDTKKFELSEDEGVQVAESNVLSQKLEGPSVKSGERKEDVPSQKSEGPPMKSEDRKEEVPPQNNASDQVEIVDIEIKKENGLVVRVSKDGIADEAASLKIASSSELTVKIGTADGTTGLSSKAITGASPKADVSTVHRKQDNNIKGSAKGEVWFLLCSLNLYFFLLHIAVMTESRFLGN